ncbi:MAG: replicative DNA helicase [SAR202 cluster bacterium]|jgi:replicative DNA helicase|nr:MAG: replicative DNA helicase [SAR202 cluster bacterium]MCH2529739.1 replicative DNA helicase [Dehalococcoidia bacterium]MQF64220.1 replicative DNA helicase [SAR202 cluster bacterium AD-802-L14_MRT_200m]KAA1300065.1 MAG: replicative DNA helicase [SAR202 cluster bacterium]MDP6960055.1 replicative DNA helicase [Dehalococcoidia bacterium]|tara:strand:+ start:161 stop:1570 length:1410 start_codon:yes stop_codon:yes gene_type:complete
MQANRLPPHDFQAEEAVLGSILIDSMTITQIAGFLSADDFYREINRQCFEVCYDLFERDEAINQITVTHEMENRGMLDDEGPGYLSHLVTVTPTSVHIKHYANLVHRTATMRRLIDTAIDIADIGYQDNPDVDDALSTAEDALFGIRQGSQNRDFVPLADSLVPYLEESSPLDQVDGQQDTSPIVTGYQRLDNLLVGGLQRSDMVVLAARPSVGKSMMGLNFTLSAAKAGYKVGIFSLEMGREQIAARLLAAQSRVNHQKIRSRIQSPSEEERVVNSIGLLSDLTIYVDDTPFQTVAEMRGKARRLQMTHGLDFLIVDYMQLINGGSSGRRDGNRAQEVSEISRQMKGMARDLKIPVLAISQLSRAVEHRTSHRPMLSDLRESGSIEQDADVVMFIHREEKFTTEEEWNKSHPTEPFPRDRATLIIAKHRNGPTDEVEMKVRDAVGIFEELSYQTQDAPSYVSGLGVGR